MSAQVQGTLLDVLKKKMRQTKEEMEKYKDECEEYQRRLQVEVMRREEVSESREIMLLWMSSFCPRAPTLGKLPALPSSARSFSLSLYIYISSLSFSPSPFLSAS